MYHGGLVSDRWAATDTTKGEFMPFSVEVTGGSPAIVQASGELDVASAPQLRASLVALDQGAVILDMAAVTFMDSSGISVLLGAHQRAVDLGHQLTVRSPSPQVTKVLAITGVDEVLTIEPAG
jgi:anti-anti-sigma factor